MKLWKYILGAIAFIGGIFAVSASTKKKDQEETDLRIKENEELTKKITEAAKKVEAAKAKTKKELTETKKKTTSTKKKLKILAVLKKLLKTLRKSIEKEVDQRKTHETITINSIVRSI